MASQAGGRTVLRELGGAQEAGDPEGLLGGLEGLVVGRQVGLGEGQLDVATALPEVGVLLALQGGRGRQRTHDWLVFNVRFKPRQKVNKSRGWILVSGHKPAYPVD